MLDMEKKTFKEKMARKNSKLLMIVNVCVFMLLLTVSPVMAENIRSQWIVQQQKSVSGKVVDSNNQPLPGATVMIKGTTRGTITGTDGKYDLPNVPENAVLVFSFVGMRTQEVLVGNQTRIDVQMEEEEIQIEEVVAIGYGTVKKSDLTGSVSRVNEKDIRKIAPTQLTESLSGTVAGLYSNQGASASGGGSLEIRGPSSLSASTTPLIVLDGVIFNGSIKEITPADIETIDIMRDASSSAILVRGRPMVLS